MNALKVVFGTTFQGTGFTLVESCEQCEALQPNGTCGNNGKLTSLIMEHGNGCFTKTPKEPELLDEEDLHL